MVIVRRPLGFICLGAVFALYIFTKLRGQPEPIYPPDNVKNITLSGIVTKKEIGGEPEKPSRVVHLKLITSNKKANTVLCYLDVGQQMPELGSTISVTGQWEAFEKATNPGQFDSYSYYQILGISYRLYQTKILTKSIEYNKMQEALYQMRQSLAAVFDAGLPETEAGVMKTMLLGEKGALDRDLKALYQRNGIAHILAISGLHISLLGMGLFKLLKRMGIPIKAACLLAAGFLVLYGAMIGFSPSAVRAIIMFLLHMSAKMLRRTYDMLTAVAVAAVLILLEQPFYLYHSGFVFSFGCVLGIGLLMPALTPGKVETDKNEKVILQVLKYIMQLILGGIAMAVITLPVYLWFYYQFPIYSILLNLVIIPLMTFLMIAGLLLLLLQFLLPMAGIPVSFFISGVLQIYENACGLCEEMPNYLFTPGKPQLWQMMCYLSILISVVVFKKKIKIWVKWIIVMAAVIILVIRPRANLEMIFLDVGQGDCIFIQSAGGESFLVDGGSSSTSAVGTYRIIPFLKYQGVHTLEAVFVTHADEDHCNGILELLEEGRRQGIKIKNLVLPEIDEQIRNSAYEELMQSASENRINILFVSQGQRIVADELTITCIHPRPNYQTENSNEYSAVLLLEYGKFSALLTGDVEGQGEREMEQYLKKEFKVSVNDMSCGKGAFGTTCWKDESGAPSKRLTLLKAAHHGSRNSTSYELLAYLQPFYAVISCGENNSYGHPHEELLERLKRMDCGNLRTDECGAITIETDGEAVKIRTFK